MQHVSVSACVLFCVVAVPMCDMSIRHLIVTPGSMPFQICEDKISSFTGVVLSMLTAAGALGDGRVVLVARESCVPVGTNGWLVAEVAN